ncbi:GNAT family N-acetyltransferase [Candidatus Poribacteria bacterium]|nr:GNAT family N-acetyltransferase [Candidatus Poribacteria bacterium]
MPLTLVKKCFFNYNVYVYTLEPLTPQNCNEWDAVIQQCPNSTAFQASVWRDALANSFKQLDPVHMLIKQNGTVIGGIPAFVFEPIPGIRLWHSMPWNLFGGPQIIDAAKVDTVSLISTIETYLQTVSSEKGWCELCWTLLPDDTLKYGDSLTEMGYARTERFTHILKTNGDIDALWHAYNKRVRGAVRKAQKSGVEVTDTESEADLSTFYDMYLTTVKRLGGTPKPRALMQMLLQHGIAKLAIATYQGTVIAGLLYLYFNRTVTLWCEASVLAYLQYRPNNAIFHHIITWACKEGYEWVDFGASPPENEGLIAHKEQYSAQKTDFCSYTKIVSSFKRSLWTQSESVLRKIYTWMQ